MRLYVPPVPFIVGAPRSGTTLLRFMLDAHPDLAVPPETGFLSLADRLKSSPQGSAERFITAVTQFPEGDPTWPDFEIPVDQFREAVLKINPFNVNDGFRVFYQLYANRFGKRRWGDKTPLYCLRMDFIRKIFPEARFIHLIRDGRDSALSLRKMWFSPGVEMKVQAAYWKKCVCSARTSGVGLTDYLEVRYESLILDPEPVLQEICRFIELPFDAAMLDYSTRAKDRLKEHKPRYHRDGSIRLTQENRWNQQWRTTQPLDLSRIQAWKKEMTFEERRQFESVAGSLLGELGYSTERVSG